jgi:hypothetical protein
VVRTLERWLANAKEWQADPYDARTATPDELFQRAK